MTATIYELVDEIRNENEKPVHDLIFQYQVESRLPCDCRECLLDIAALALNALKPRYVVSLVTRLHEREEEVTQFNDEVRQAVEDACQIVKARPHHSDNRVSTTPPPTFETDDDELEE